MTSCDSLVAAVLAETTAGWYCRAVSDDTVLLVSPHHYADGDAVEVMIKTIGEEVVVHDGGEVAARLDAAGLRIDSGRLKESWTRLLRAHAVDHHRGMVLKRTASSQVAQAVHDMVDALANLDGLRLLAPPPRALPFHDQIVTVLEADFPQVERRVRLTGESGLSYQLTAAASYGKRQVYIQAAAGRTAQAQRSAVEHAYTAFSDINGIVSADRKLVVLDDQRQEWSSRQVKLLANVAYVGTWTARDRWIDFVKGDVPKHSHMLLAGEQRTLQNTDP
jgi:hypothetical protein